MGVHDGGVVMSENELLTALKEIRRIAYGAPYAAAPERIIRILRVAEEAIADAEKEAR